MTDPQQLRARTDEVFERHESGDLQGALDAADALLAAAESSSVDDPVVRESVFAARFERGVLLTELGDLAAAADAYAEAAATPADLTDPDQRHEVVMAELNRAILTDAAGRHDEALDTYDGIITRFADAADPVTAELVVRARVNRAAALLALDRPSEALATSETLVADLDGAQPGEAEQLAMAVRIRASALRAMDRADEAAAALAAVERCNAEDPAARAQVVAAQGDRVRWLADLGRYEEADDLVAAVVTRFGDDPEVAGAVEELRRLRPPDGDAAGDGRHR